MDNVIGSRSAIATPSPSVRKEQGEQRVKVAHHPIVGRHRPQLLDIKK